MLINGRSWGQTLPARHSDDVTDGLEAARDRFAMPPETVAHAIAYAIDQPPDIDVAEIIIRATVQP